MNTPISKVLHESKGIEDSIAAILPVLRAMDDASAAEALKRLYEIAFEKAFEASDGIAKEMGGYLTKIVTARLKGKPEDVLAAVDEFVADRCIVKGGSAPTPSH
jgi:hypothetical protein